MDKYCLNVVKPILNSYILQWKNILKYIGNYDFNKIQKYTIAICFAGLRYIKVYCILVLSLYIILYIL